jgi:hypothetical protein
LRTLRAHWNLLTCALLVVMTIAFAAPAPAQTTNPDREFFTYYVALGSHTLQWATCETRTEQCHGSGQLGPFTNACAVVESVPAVLDASTVVRYIYVLDSGSRTDDASLVAYRRIDTISRHEDNISVIKEATVPLPSIVAGTGASCLMVQNPTNVYAGTKQSGTAVSINKKTHDVTTLNERNGTLSSMTADSNGFVTVNRGEASEATSIIYGPDGELLFPQRGPAFVINPISSVNPADYSF